MRGTARSVNVTSRLLRPVAECICITTSYWLRTELGEDWLFCLNDS